MAYVLMKDLPTGIVQCEGYRYSKDSYRDWGYFRVNGRSYSGGEGPKCYTPDPPRKFASLDDQWHGPIEVEARYETEVPTGFSGTVYPEVYSLRKPGAEFPFFQIHTYRTARAPGGARENRSLYREYMQEILTAKFEDLRGEKLKEAIYLARLDPKKSQLYVEERIKQLESFVTSLLRDSGRDYL